MSDTVLLALLAFLGTGFVSLAGVVTKLWVDIRALTISDTECKVERAKADGKIAILEARCMMLQDKINQIERAAIRSVHNPEQAIIEANGMGVITEWSPGAEELFGWTAHEAIGHKISSIIVPPDLKERHEQAISSLLESHRISLTHKIPNIRSLRKNLPEIVVDIHLNGWKNPSDTWVLIARFEERNEGE